MTLLPADLRSAKPGHCCRTPARASAVANGAGPGRPTLTLPYEVDGRWYLAALHAPRDGGLVAAVMPMEPIMSVLDDAATATSGAVAIIAPTGRIWIAAPFAPPMVGKPITALTDTVETASNTHVAEIASPFGLRLSLNQSPAGMPEGWWADMMPTILISALLILAASVAVRVAAVPRDRGSLPADQSAAGHLVDTGDGTLAQPDTDAGTDANADANAALDTDTGSDISAEQAPQAAGRGLPELLRPLPIVAYRARIDGHGNIDLHDVHVGALPNCRSLESGTENPPSAFLETLYPEDRFSLERAIQLAAGLPGDDPVPANGGWLRLGTPEDHIWMRHRLQRVDGGDHVDIHGLLVESNAENAEHAALIEARDAAESVSLRKSRFIASVSHELRTPLNAIIGFAELMENETLGPIGTPRYKGYLSDISTSGRHLRDLINDIIDISRVEAEELDLADTIFDVGGELQSCARLVGEQIDAAGLEFVDDIPDGLPKLRADALRFRQIVLNLLGNSIKFTPSGGEIGVSARMTPDGLLRISVIDTGVGMDDQGIERALQPFGRVENPDRAGVEGTGLGLPIARALMEFHGGKLDIVSALDAGTTVNLTFPIDRLVDSDERAERFAATGA